MTKLLPTSPVDGDQIGRFEQGRQTRVAHLNSRLDMVYGADGHTCWEPVEVIDGPSGESRILFPEYWVGPVTIRAFKRAGVSEPFQQIAIRWGDWATDVQLASGTTVTLRQSTPEARGRRTPSPTWGVTAGVGYDAGAVDINTGWHLVDAKAKKLHFERLKPIYLRLFNKTPEDFEQFEMLGKART